MREEFMQAPGISDDDILSEMGVVRAVRPECQFGMNPDEHELKEAVGELPADDRELLVRFAELLVARHHENFE